MPNVALRLPTLAPFIRLLSAMQDENDRDQSRNGQTDAAPPFPEDRDTQPPDPIAEAGAAKALSTMLPAALPAAPSAPAPAPPEYWKASYDKLCEIHEDSRRDREAAKERDNVLVVRVSDAIAARLEPRFAAIEGKDKTQDAKLEIVATELATLRQQVADMQRIPIAYDNTLNGINGTLTNIQLQLDAFATSFETRSLSGKTVVVVDNETALVSTIARNLRKSGASVSAAHSWAELRLLKLDQVDCVLIDLLLGADDGLEIAAWLTAERGVPSHRIILMTGHVHVANTSGLKLLQKPFSTPDLIQEILASLKS